MAGVSVPHEDGFTESVNLGGFAFDVNRGMFIPTAGYEPPPVPPLVPQEFDEYVEYEGEEVELDFD